MIGRGGCDPAKRKGSIPVQEKEEIGMMKFLLKIDVLAVLLAFLALLSLSMTIMAPTEMLLFDPQEMALSGLHLWEFTSAGFLIMAAPIVIVLMSKMHTRMQNKYLILLGTLVLTLIGYNAGILAGSDWICAVTGGGVQYERAIIAYPFLMLMSVSILMIHMDFADFYEEYEEEFDECFEADAWYPDSYGQ